VCRARLVERCCYTARRHRDLGFGARPLSRRRLDRYSGFTRGFSGSRTAGAARTALRLARSGLPRTADVAMQRPAEYTGGSRSPPTLQSIARPRATRQMPEWPNSQTLTPAHRSHGLAAALDDHPNPQQCEAASYRSLGSRQWPEARRGGFTACPGTAATHVRAERPSDSTWLCQRCSPRREFTRRFPRSSPAESCPSRRSARSNVASRWRTPRRDWSTGGLRRAAPAPGWARFRELGTGSWEFRAA